MINFNEYAFLNLNLNYLDFKKLKKKNSNQGNRPDKEDVMSFEKALSSL